MSDALNVVSSISSGDVLVISQNSTTRYRGVEVSSLQDYMQENLDFNPDASTNSVTATGTTTARTLAARFGDDISVKDFGAVGDGTTDDTTAIQTAISYATVYGKAVFFPTSQTPYICGQLAITCSMYAFPGQSATLKRKAATTGYWLTINTDSVIIANLELNGNTVVQDGIEVSNCSDVTLDSLTITSLYGYAIHFNGATRLKVINNTIKSGYNGISNVMAVDSASAAISYDAIISGNAINGLAGTGIYISGKQAGADPMFPWTNPLLIGGVISQNSIRSCSGHGIIGQSYCLSISSNEIVGCGSIAGRQSIVCQGKHMTVTGNTIYGGAGVGIDMGACYYSAVTGNNVRGQAQIGIELQSCVSVTCTGNAVVDCASSLTGESSAGIAILQGFFGGSYTNVNSVVVGNTVTSSGVGTVGQYGVSVGTGVTAATISGNNLIGSGTVGPILMNGSALFIGNMTATSEENLSIAYGATPKFVARSASGNTDFWMSPQGTGTLRVEKFMTTATTPANFVAQAALQIKDQAGNNYYIPLKTSIW